LEVTVFVLLLALYVKHFVCDFMFQTPWMYLNKGTYLHPGGVTHSALHGIFTAVILAAAGIPFALLFALADFLVHYHVDWAKVKISSIYGLTPTNSEAYWILLGLDQLLHSLTYLAILFITFVK
jgi:hypothetical protein